MRKSYKRRQLNALKNPLRFYWMLMNMCFPKFGVYQTTVAPNCFKSYTNSLYPDFFQNKKNVFSCPV